jgi:hypothetical protein
MDALRERAELYAQLASIEELKGWERMKLEGDIQQIILPFLNPDNFGTEEAHRRTAVSLLPLIHRWVRELYIPLLDGKACEMSLTWTLADGVLKGRRQEVKIEEQIRWDLQQCLQIKPASIRRCPHCQTVFVPVKQQKFCSPNCVYETGKITYKESKRIYMREYQAKLRKQKKKGRPHD